jgi:uncharacterized protein (TIGR02217 family)
MAFHDVRLPDQVERGSHGGPRFKTTVIDLSSGAEQRNIDWSLTRHYWEVSYGVSNRADYEEVRDFFMNRRGRAHTFRFRDWTDYQLTLEQIGTGDGVETEFQITKTYTGSFPYVRNITRPVASTLVVKINGVTTTAYTLNALGVIEFNVAPALADIITVSCDFDIPMRFDTDQFDLVPEWSEASAVGSLPIIEVRDVA